MEFKIYVGLIFSFTFMSYIQMVIKSKKELPTLKPVQGMKVWSIGSRRKQNDTNSIFGGKTSKNLNFWDLTVIGVGSSLGVGISVLIGGLIKDVTGPAVLVSIFLAGVTALIGGLCCAEFGVRFLKIDSAYSYSYFWGRENVAFIFGWALILEYVAGTASAAKGIITFIDALSDYKISDFLKNSTSTDFPEVFPYFDFLSLGIVVIFTLIIAFEMKNSLLVKQLFTICNLILIASIVVGGAVKADARNWLREDAEDKLKGFAPFGVLGIVKGAAVAFYGFIGFDASCVSGEEIKKRKRNLPLVILITVLILLVAHVAVGLTLTLMLPYNKLDPFAAVPIAFQQAGWISFKWVVAAATFFGFQTSLFGAIFPLPIIIRAMANDGLLFSFLGNCHSKFKTPIMSTIFGGLLAAAAAGIFPFQKLVNLTIVGALFVYTVLSINLILLRYSSTFENDEKPPDSWKNLINKNSEVSVKAVIKNYFNFKEKHPTNLTKIIITGNLVLFCISSIGISVIFNIFYDDLVKNYAKAVIPASILLTVMIFNLISITCQPKSEEFISFKVLLVPFIPCLSILLNIFLMVTFESLTWIIFSVWMAIGILLHLSLHFFKCFKGEIGKNSLYEINKTNAVKLNESIWKIKSDKKSFYEGAINPVFSDEFENKSNQIMTNIDFEIQKPNEKTSLELKQAEIIQTAESIVERTEPLKSEPELNFIRVSEDEEPNSFQEEEKVLWECIAEIHTEEFPQESVALEIVDNTYNFLSEVSEDVLKDDVNSEGITETSSLQENIIGESKTAEDDAFKASAKDTEVSDTQQLPQKHDLNCLKEGKQQSFKEELLSKIEMRINNKKIKETTSNPLQPMIFEENQSKVLNSNTLEDEFLKDSTGSKPALNGKNENQGQFINLIAETFYKPQPNEIILQQNKMVPVLDSKATEMVSDEQNKIKEFKEKLNQLLKEQLNATLTKSSIPIQYFDSENMEKTDEKNKESLNKSIKTLNKSQIKGKLEFLLSKGPPKRPSLGSSFNLKIKHSDQNIELENAKDAILKNNVKNNNLNGNTKEENFEKSSESLPNGIKEKLFPLNDGKLSNDVCC